MTKGTHMSRKKRLIYIIPLAILGTLAFMAIGGAVVMLLWNWLLPSLFSVRLITFWQALGILLLCRILFGRFGFRNRRPDWRRRFDERCDHMTPEERDQFRQRMRERWGLGPSTAESKGQ